MFPPAASDTVLGEAQAGHPTGRIPKGSCERSNAFPGYSVAAQVNLLACAFRRARDAGKGIRDRGRTLTATGGGGRYKLLTPLKGLFSSLFFLFYISLRAWIVCGRLTPTTELTSCLKG